MSKPLVLFHGFETYSNYNKKDFKVEYTFTYQVILSKTICFRIAPNYFQPKYLIIYYPSCSKHLGLDTKSTE